MTTINRAPASEVEPVLTLRSLLTGLKKHLDAGGSWAKLPPGDHRTHTTAPELESEILGRLLEEVDALPSWSVFRDGTTFLEATRKLLAEMPEDLKGSWASDARALHNSIRAAEKMRPAINSLLQNRYAAEAVSYAEADAKASSDLWKAQRELDHERAEAPPDPVEPDPLTRLADRYPGLGLYLRDLGEGHMCLLEGGRRNFFAPAFLELADLAHREPGEAPLDPDPEASSREAVLRSGEGRIREDPDEKLAEEFRAKAESPRANPRYHLLVPAWLVREAADFLGVAATDSKDLDQDLARELRAALHLNSAVPEPDRPASGRVVNAPGRLLEELGGTEAADPLSEISKAVETFGVPAAVMGPSLTEQASPEGRTLPPHTHLLVPTELVGEVTKFLGDLTEEPGRSAWLRDSLLRDSVPSNPVIDALVEGRSCSECARLRGALWELEADDARRPPQQRLRPEVWWKSVLAVKAPNPVGARGLDLDAAADRVIAARVRKGQPSATDLGKTVNGILEEGGEFARRLRRGAVEEQADALLDLMVYCLGGLRILGRDVGRELAKVLDRNETREHEGSH